MNIIETFDITTQNILKELEKTQHDFWNISRVTAEFMYNFIIDANINHRTSKYDKNQEKQ